MFIAILSSHVEAENANIIALPYYESQSIETDDLLYGLFAPANENDGLIALRKAQDKVIGQAWGD